MTLITWREEYRVGVPALDAEHRAMIDLINLIYDQLQTGAKGVTIIDFLGEIYARIKSHFSHEEAVMRAHRYPNYETHRDDHDQLLDEITEIMYDYQDGIIKSDDLLTKRLDNWFSVHFGEHDLPLHLFLRKTGVPVDTLAVA